MRKVLTIVALLVSTPALANVTTCQIEGIEYTFNENFGTWANDKRDGNLTVSKPGHWEMDVGDRHYAVRAKSGGKATVLVTNDEGQEFRKPARCEFIGTGRTPGN